MKIVIKWIACLLLMWMTHAHAALLEETRVVSATAAAASMLPPVQSFTIATSGTYTLRLTDAVKQGVPGTAFTSLSVLIYRNAQLIKHLALSGSAASATSNVTLAAGQYKAQVFGVTTGASLFQTDLSDAGAVSVWNHAGGINAPPVNDFSNLQQQLTLTAGASYTVTITDRNFPAALTSLLSVVAQGASTTCSQMNIQGSTASCSFVASSAGNILTVLADPTNGAGIYSAKVVKDSDGSVVYSASLPLGTALSPVTVSFPANDSYALTSLDFAVPAPLSSFRVLLLQGGDLLTSQSTTGSIPAFTAGSGSADLYVLATPAPSSSGFYSVNIKRGATTVFSTDKTVNATGGAEGYVFPVSLPAGSYTLQLRDFVFPQTFTSLEAKVTQGTISLGSPLAAAGTMNFTVTTAGEVNIAVLGKPAAGADAVATGLFGIGIIASGNATPVFEKTQGVGGSFASTTINVTSPTRYAVSATDFAAPATLDQLRVAVTRGSQLIGSIFGGGTFAFDTTAGEYRVNYLAKAKSSTLYGSYGTTVLTAPAVTLTADPSSINAGGSATLNWSSTDAATCTASGGWSGTKETGGTATVGPLAANTTFTLTCSNPAGETVVSSNVTVQAQAAAAPAKKKGGGAWSTGWLLGIAGLGLLRRVRHSR